MCAQSPAAAEGMGVKDLYSEVSATMSTISRKIEEEFFGVVRFV
jgi:hypothetical protein